ncbi:MAG: hypothetical protein Q4G02_03850 [bacterium]|nr:hypothetical protein [bacterium]
MALEKIGYQNFAPEKWQAPVNKRVNTPEQLQALRLARDLQDETHKKIYLSLCKRYQPGLIAEAQRFISDAQAENRAKLFMWKIRQLNSAWRADGKEPLRTDVAPAKRRRRKITPAQLFEAETLAETN